MVSEPTERDAARITLRDEALTGFPALAAELVTIACMAAIVLLAHHFAADGAEPWMTLYVPLVALGLGALGAVFAGPHAAGMLRTPGYLRRYCLVITLMIGVDLGVRTWLGGDRLMVVSNWAVLIGSASAVNLLVTRVPLLNARRFVDEGQIASFHPVTMALIVALQLAQAWISVLGAGWVVVVVSLLARRVAILPIAHLIARQSYGAGCAQRLRDNETLEYVAIRSISDAQGRVIEADAAEQTVVGTMLLKLPMFAGESMSAGRKSLTRLGDKLVFLEQMLAFSSPTMVVAHVCALGHIAFLHALTSLDSEPAPCSPKLADRQLHKARVRDAIRGNWSGFR